MVWNSWTEKDRMWDLRLFCVSWALQHRFCGVMVSTLDSESSDPSSNLGRTSFCDVLPSDNWRIHFVLIDKKQIQQCSEGEHIDLVLSTYKKQALLGFEPRISCLLDRHFNQLSHRARDKRHLRVLVNMCYALVVMRWVTMRHLCNIPNSYHKSQGEYNI